MKSIESIGKNFDEALNNALSELNVTREKVEVDIIEEGSKGLFNIFGSKPTKLKVTLKNDYKEDAKEFLSKVLSAMNLEGNIEIIEDDKSILFNISGDNMGTIIGYRGDTLDSLQYLLSLVVNKNHDMPYKRVILDTENYRKKREETLKRLADKTAYKVLKNRRSFKLEPMNPYERRVIHAALQGRSDICTYSEGEEPYRRIVVDLKKN